MGLFDIFKVNNEADIFGKYNLLSTAGKFDTGYKQDTKGLVKFVKKHLKNGAIILFDEFYGFPNWEKYEYKAFKENFDNSEYKYIAFSNRQACVKIV